MSSSAATPIPAPMPAFAPVERSWDVLIVEVDVLVAAALVAVMAVVDVIVDAVTTTFAAEVVPVRALVVDISVIGIADVLVIDVVDVLVDAILLSVRDASP